MTTTPNQVWCDSRLYSPSENGQLLKAIMLYHEAIEDNNKAVLYFHVVKEATLLVCFYDEPAEARPSVFDCFYNIPCIKQGMNPGNKTLLNVVEGIAAVLNTEEKL